MGKLQSTRADQERLERSLSSIDKEGSSAEQQKHHHLRQRQQAGLQYQISTPEDEATHATIAGPDAPTSTDADTTTLASQHTPLDLPPEMRNIIYSHLVKREDIVVRPYLRNRSDVTESRRAEPPQPPIALSCKQIRAESLSIFDSESRFHLAARSTHIDSPDHTALMLRRWRTILGSRAANIQHIL